MTENKLTNPTTPSAYEALMSQYKAAAAVTPVVKGSDLPEASILGAVGDTYRLAKYIAVGTISTVRGVVQLVPSAFNYANLGLKELVLQSEAAFNDVTVQEMEALNEIYSQMTPAQRSMVTTQNIRKIVLSIRNAL